MSSEQKSDENSMLETSSSSEDKNHKTPEATSSSSDARRQSLEVCTISSDSTVAVASSKPECLLMQVKSQYSDLSISEDQRGKAPGGYVSSSVGSEIVPEDAPLGLKQRKSSAEKDSKPDIRSLKRIHQQDDQESSSSILPKTLRFNFLLLDESNLAPEPESDYCYGGYCRVWIGTLINEKYRIMRKLGWGGYSTVYLALNEQTKEFVAMKIAKSADNYTFSSNREIQFHTIINNRNSNSVGAKHVSRLLDSFIYRTFSGNHVVMVFAMAGPNTYSIQSVSNQKQMHLNHIKTFSRQLLESVNFLHTECGIVHCDIKPINIMVNGKLDDFEKLSRNTGTCSSFAIDLTDPSSKLSITLGDFGVSCKDGEQWKCMIQTCSYRAPEIFLRNKLTPAIDLWSIGCVIYEWITGVELFNCDPNGNEMEDVMFHLKKANELFGNVCKNLYVHNEYVEMYFGHDGMLKNNSHCIPDQLFNTFTKQQFMSTQDARDCVELLSGLLHPDPHQRLTAEKALMYAFVQPCQGSSDSGLDSQEPCTSSMRV